MSNGIMVDPEDFFNALDNAEQNPPFPSSERSAEADAESELLPCAWVCDFEGIWQTDCGEAFVFEIGGPVENKLKFCGYCGKGLVESHAPLSE